MVEKPRDLVERSFQFALAIIRLCKVCEPATERRGHWLANSFGPPHRSAQRLRSPGRMCRADFINKYAIALKEARETRFPATPTH